MSNKNTSASQMTITISSDTPHYATIMTKEGLSSSEKTISFDALTNILGAHSKRSTPLLPNNLLRMKEDKQSARYMVQVPARKRKIEYRTGATINEYDIMTPNLVYVAKADHDGNPAKVTFGDGQLFATVVPVVTGFEETYHAPFGNIYKNPESHNRDRICWGLGANLGTSLKMIDMHMAIFFQAVFNTDLDDNRFVSHEIEGARIFKTNHLFVQMDKMFQDGASEQEVLAYLHKHMLKQSSATVNSYFDSI